MSTGISLEFALPGDPLTAYVSTYYLFRCDAPRIEDVDRADVAQIRFMLKGSGEFRFPGGTVEASCPVMINGPGSGAAHYQVDGPFHCFGIALRPLGWGAIVNRRADLYADHAVDGSGVWGDEALALLETLRDLDTLEAMVAATEPFLLAHLSSVDPAHAIVIEQIRLWLADPEPRSIDTLIDALGYSERHVVRLANRYFGAPPKLLARKVRALRAASCLIEGRPIDARLAEQFYDQPHMIREIRHFTGKTPGQLRGPIEPILHTTLQGEHFRELDSPG